MWDTIKKDEIWTGLITKVGNGRGLYALDSNVQPLFDEQRNIAEFIAPAGNQRLNQ
ncbi:hypothetical protein [Pseudomonas sp. R62]|uniref:hypothetical protein n=1 Tax=Pseudomonas sp. R62 TaxID=1144884 RepID=UPI0002D8848E|nr:hypothetical protein [Pseudomonas sp. R62]